MHPIFQNRCERDGLKMESMWLGDEDIERDDGTTVPIKQPSALVTRPLSERDQDDRVRMALGLTHDDPLPVVTQEILRAWSHFLKGRLKLPFKARVEDDGSSLTVHRLLDLKEWELTAEVGLLGAAQSREGPVDVPLAELDPTGSGSPQLIADHGHWSGNYG